MKKTIVIPFHNEARLVAKVMPRFAALITDDVEVILVDNGSTDGTASVMKEQVEVYTFAKMVMVEEYIGFGDGVMMGLGQATGDYVGFLTPQSAMEPINVIRAFYQAERFGKKVFAKGREKELFLAGKLVSDLTSVFTTLLLGERMEQIWGEPCVFPREFINKWWNPPVGEGIFLYTYYMAKQCGMPIVRFSTAGHSKCTSICTRLKEVGKTAVGLHSKKIR